MTRIMLGFIRFYQKRISPLSPPQCRYFPSCSEYAATAIQTHGPLKGLYLGVRRLLRCHPLREGGLDPVPAKHPRAS